MTTLWGGPSSLPTFQMRRRSLRELSFFLKTLELGSSRAGDSSMSASQSHCHSCHTLGLLTKVISGPTCFLGNLVVYYARAHVCVHVCVCTCVCACVLDVYSCVTKYHKLGCLEQCILLVSVSVEPRSGLTRSVMKVSVSPDLT